MTLNPLSLLNYTRLGTNVPKHDSMKGLLQVLICETQVSPSLDEHPESG